MANPTFVVRWLGRRVKELREECDFTLRVVGQHLGRDTTAVSKMESGVTSIKRGDLLAFMEKFGVPQDSELREHLLQIYEETRRKQWWDEYSEEASTGLLDLIWLENHATQILSYESDAIPGLLQTPAYANVLVAVVPDPREEWKRRMIQLRLRRQVLLESAPPPALTFVISEACLRHDLGDPAISREQLHHLLTINETPGIRIRILPIPRLFQPYVRGSFALMELPEPYPSVAYQETMAGAVLYTEAAPLDRAREVYAGLVDQSLSATESAKLIRTIAEELG